MEMDNLLEWTGPRTLAIKWKLESKDKPLAWRYAACCKNPFLELGTMTWFIFSLMPPPFKGNTYSSLTYLNLTLWKIVCDRNVFIFKLFFLLLYIPTTLTTIHKDINTCIAVAVQHPHMMQQWTCANFRISASLPGSCLPNWLPQKHTCGCACNVCEISNWLKIQINSSVIVYGHLFRAVKGHSSLRHLFPWQHLHGALWMMISVSSFRGIGNWIEIGPVRLECKVSPGSTYIWVLSI